MGRHQDTISSVYVVDTSLYQGLAAHMLAKEKSPDQKTDFQKLVAAIRKEIRQLPDKESILGIHFTTPSMDNSIVDDWTQNSDHKRLFAYEALHTLENGKMMRYLVDNFKYAAVVPLADIRAAYEGHPSTLVDFIESTQIEFPATRRLQVRHPKDLPIPQYLDAALTNLPLIVSTSKDYQNAQDHMRRAQRQLDDLKIQIGIERADPRQFPKNYDN